LLQKIYKTEGREEGAEASQLKTEAMGPKQGFSIIWEHA